MLKMDPWVVKLFYVVWSSFFFNFIAHRMIFGWVGV